MYTHTHTHVHTHTHTHAGKQIEETTTYKYLGVELGKGLHFKLFKDRKIKEARQKMMRVWAME
jgi:hypothetical protein